MSHEPKDIEPHVGAVTHHDGSDSGEEIHAQRTVTYDAEKTHGAEQIESYDPELEHIATRFGGDGPDGLAPKEDLQEIMDKVGELSVEEARQILEEMLDYHRYDYNFPALTREKMQSLIEGPAPGQKEIDWRLEIKTEAALNKFYSPYPEVRAVTEPKDDVDIPCETLRAHFLGYAWAIIAQFTNGLFMSRYPNISITSPVIQLLLYPCGLGMALVLPDWGFTISGKRVSLNPGPWTYKEQMLATVIVNVSVSTAYCFYNIQTQDVLYKDKWLTPGYEILLLLSTQLMGLGFAGLMRRFAVYPIEAIWPSILPTVALNRALLVPETKARIHGWGISRYRWFFICFVGMFLYFWIPGYLFTALSTFAWMCWIAPNNFNLNVVTGGVQGLGLNPIPTFDWNVASLIIQPLQSPFFATIQQTFGALLSALIILALYYSNVNWSGYLPINSSHIFNNTGGRYEINKVLYPGTAIVNQTAYEEYSPPYYAASNLAVYGAFFAYYPFTMAFICLDAWRPLLRATKAMSRAMVKTVKSTVSATFNVLKNLVTFRFKEAGRAIYDMTSFDESIYDEFDNPFTNMMRNYAEVPDWWFLMIAFISFIFSIIILTHWTELDTPVWTIFFVIALNLVFMVPMTYLFAISGTTAGLNVLTELVVGYALPGRPEALMFVKAFGYNIAGQTDTYVSDQKMGCYAKIPPRSMFRGQVISAIITSLICYATVNFVDTSIVGICTPDQAQKFTCNASSITFFSASVVWVSHSVYCLDLSFMLTQYLLGCDRSPTCL